MQLRFQSFLIIQTAFIGDVILATGLIEKLNGNYPDASIDFLLRKGNEGLLVGHPKLRHVLIWDKSNSKVSNLIKLVFQVRKNQYDCVVNVHRFATSGLITIFSGSKMRIGFDKNPMSFLFSETVKHRIDGLHEVQRNHQLIESLTDANFAKPKLYPAQRDFEKVSVLKAEKYICLAPTSVWFTKQLPAEKWIGFLSSAKNAMPKIYLLGSPSDHHTCESVRLAVGFDGIINLAGQLSFLESAALMKDAVMNFVNDSAPMHLASAMNAPVTAVFCSTVPSFGFGPLSDKSVIVETKEKLDCRPCGLHGYKDCPKEHFNCAYSISNDDLVTAIKPEL
jgi:heptosyltransferase II